MDRRAPLHDDVAVHGQAGEIEIRRESDEAEAPAPFDGSVTAHVHVEARLRMRDLDVEGLPARPQVLADGPRQDRCLVAQGGMRHGTVIDLDDPVTASRHVADMHAVGEAYVQGEPSAPLSMRIDQGLCRCGKAGLPDGMLHGPAFPIPVIVLADMLGRAAAAFPEIGTERLHALRRCGQPLDDLGTPSVPLHDYPFAGQRIGYVDASVLRIRDPVRLGAEARDGDGLRHGAPPAEIPGCRRPRRWARGRCRGRRSPGTPRTPRDRRRFRCERPGRERCPCAPAHAPPRTGA